MPDAVATLTSGVQPSGYQPGAATSAGWVQRVMNVGDRVVSADVRTGTFRTPGRATANQKLMTLMNGAGCGVIVVIEHLVVDVVQTAAAVAIGVVPPMVRVNRISAAPTGGTVLSKVTLDSTQTSNASVVLTGDAQADSSLSTTALAVTAGGLVAQAHSPRIVQATGTAGNVPVLETFDVMRFFDVNREMYLRPGEGLVVQLDGATATTGNPATHLWLGIIDWQEFTRP